MRLKLGETADEISEGIELMLHHWPGRASCSRSAGQELFVLVIPRKQSACLLLQRLANVEPSIHCIY
jgi:hypothetical protein